MFGNVKNSHRLYKRKVGKLFVILLVHKSMAVCNSLKTRAAAYLVFWKLGYINGVKDSSKQVHMKGEGFLGKKKKKEWFCSQKEKRTWEKNPLAPQPSSSSVVLGSPHSVAQAGQNYVSDDLIIY